MLRLWARVRSVLLAQRLYNGLEALCTLPTHKWVSRFSKRFLLNFGSETFFFSGTVLKSVEIVLPVIFPVFRQNERTLEYQGHPADQIPKNRACPCTLLSEGTTFASRKQRRSFATRLQYVCMSCRCARNRLYALLRKQKSKLEQSN